MAADTVLGVLKKFPTPAQKNPQNQLKPTYRTFIKGVVHFFSKIADNLACHPRYPCHSFFS